MTVQSEAKILNELLQRLIDRTTTGSLEWERSDDGNHFLSVSDSGSTVEIVGPGSALGVNLAGLGPPAELTIYAADGSVVGSIKGRSLASVAISIGGLTPASTLVDELWNSIVAVEGTKLSRLEQVLSDFS